ncbi:MAG TPA: MerR family transcriptional regulator [Bacteroidetes bacterium]|nr:HTH-type transcriptional repressor YcgE [bacterium BMS3Bbin04]HDO65762.1 MerR family transcriptional regulator [Bacteroidota bacterium]HEX04887.1 MerR family transcriptional regulator [Bacteroidota bacterium]
MSSPIVTGAKLFSIGQVHAITGIPKPTLRFWEKEFSGYLEPIRTEGNQRRYDEVTIQRIERINRLVHKEGYTLEGARRKLAAEDAAKEAAEAAMPGIDEKHLHQLAETMSDYLLKKLFMNGQTGDPQANGMT